MATNEDGSYKLDKDGNIITETNPQVEDNVNYKGIPYYQTQLNQFIQTFSEAVNQIFKSGYVSDASTEDEANKVFHFLLLVEAQESLQHQQ